MQHPLCCQLQDERPWTVLPVGLRTCGTEAFVAFFAWLRSAAQQWDGLFLEALMLTLCYCLLQGGGQGTTKSSEDGRALRNVHKTEVIIKSQRSRTTRRELTISSVDGRGKQTSQEP